MYLRFLVPVITISWKVINIHFDQHTQECFNFHSICVDRSTIALHWVQIRLLNNHCSNSISKQIAKILHRIKDLFGNGMRNIDVQPVQNIMANRCPQIFVSIYLCFLLWLLLERDLPPVDVLGCGSA